MNVLSLFDGKSSGYTACELAGIPVNNYYSAEVDKYAIKVSDAIHPNQIRLGDVTKWRNWDIDWASIDMILGGFPCQAWSMAGKQMGDKDERGMLFWTMLDIMKHVRHHNPKADFLIENVKMKKEFEEYITFHMNNAVGNVHKNNINAISFAPQNRDRIFWTSFPVSNVTCPKNLTLRDIICDIGDEFDITDSYNKKPEGTSTFRNSRKNVRTLDQAAKCLTASGQNVSNAGATNVLMGDGTYKKLSPRECFILQSVPTNYIDKILRAGLSKTQLYKIAGNGWNDEVIAHILGCYKG